MTQYDQLLLDLFTDPNIKRPSSKCKKGSHLYDLLMTQTSFLKESKKTITTGERLWYVKNNIHTIVKCPVCGSPSSANLRDNKIRACSYRCGQQMIDKDSGLTATELRAKRQSITKQSRTTKQVSAVVDKYLKTMNDTVCPDTGLSLRLLRNQKVAETKKIKKYTPWNKGVEMSEQQKQQLSKTRLEKFTNGELVHWNTGNDTPECTKKKISKTLQTTHHKWTEQDTIKRNKTLTDKKHSGWIHHKTQQLEDILHNSVNPKAYDLFHDREWLYTQHIDNKRTLSSICVELGIDWKKHSTALSMRMKAMDIPIFRHTTQSAPQQELEQFIRQLGVDFVTNTRKEISPHELDIYLPQFNLAIEFNGLYWHSEIHKNPNYHLNKTLQCEQKSIRLLHIFEDEWRDDKEKCKTTIRHLLGKSEKGVYARKTFIREIPWKQAKSFLDKHHLLNAGQPGNYRIGAFDCDDELIGVMVFGPQNNENSDSAAVELRRFVTNKKNNPGLGSKMFNYAISHNNYNQVIAFVDRRWFTGLVKQFIGFEVVSVTPPAIWWTDGTQRHHRRFTTKQQLIERGMDPALSKRDMMQQKGYVRIWDCGKVKLMWQLEKQKTKHSAVF